MCMHFLYSILLTAFQIKAFEHLKVFEHDEFSSRITTSSEVTGDRNLERRLRRRHQVRVLISAAIRTYHLFCSYSLGQKTLS